MWHDTPRSLRTPQVKHTKHAGVRKLLLVLGVVVVVGALLVEVVLPTVIEQSFSDLVERRCESCHLKLESTSLRFFPLGLTFGGLAFSGGRREATLIEAFVPKLAVEFNWSHSSLHELVIERVEITGVEVRVVEGDESSHPRANTENWSQSRSFRIRSATLKDAKFTYLHEGQSVNGPSPIEINDLQVKIDEFGSAPDLLGKKVHAQVTGRLEKTGKLDLGVDAEIFSKPDALTPDVDVALRLRGFSLAEMNRFFKPYDGIELEGTLVDGQVRLTVDGLRQNAKVMANYTGLKVHFEKDKDRGAIAAFFSRLGESILIDRSSEKESVSDRTRTVSLERLPNESLISFLLRGMKEAAMSVASSKAVVKHPH